MMNEGLMDGRRERGERTRHTVAARAAAVASIDGLAGMTLSKLADALNVSKSSIQAAFRTKEEVQLAAVGAATEIFVANVIAPARGHPEGLERLDALVECWLGYIERRVLPGGCFMGATFAEFDSRPGPVRDALAQSRSQWLGILQRQISKAQTNKQLPVHPSAALLAFEIDAILAAANVARNMHDDDDALNMARQLIGYQLHGRPGLTATAPSSKRRRNIGDRPK
jgi:AcrR family transcriptional regulator